MGIQEEDIDALSCLGFTDRQAKIYLSLVSAGPATVKVISKLSTVPRQETYRVITDLYKKGFIEKILTTPITFRATPLQQAIDILFQSKEAEIERTLAKTNQLIDKFKHKTAEITPEDPIIFLESGMAKNMSSASKGMENDKICVDLAGPWEMFLSWLFTVSEKLHKANHKKVVYRVIINKPKNPQTLVKITSLLKGLPNFSIKFSGEKAPLLCSIHDKKLVTLALLSSDFNPNELNTMKTGNPTLVELIQTYFDNLWDKLA